MKAFPLQGKLGIRSAAKLAGLCPSSILRYCKLGRLRSEKIGGQIIINESDLSHFLSLPRQVGSPGYSKR